MWGGGGGEVGVGGVNLPFLYLLLLVPHNIITDSGSMQDISHMNLVMCVESVLQAPT